MPGSGLQALQHPSRASRRARTGRKRSCVETIRESKNAIARHGRASRGKAVRRTRTRASYSTLESPRDASHAFFRERRRRPSFAARIQPEFAAEPLPPPRNPFLTKNNSARKTLPKEKSPVQESAFRPPLVIFVQKVNKISLSQLVSANPVKSNMKWRGSVLARSLRKC
jgi:hypothetical protein